MANFVAIQYKTAASFDWYTLAKWRDGALVINALLNATDFQQPAGLQRMVFESIQLKY